VLMKSILDKYDKDLFIVVICVFNAFHESIKGGCLR